MRRAGHIVAGLCAVGAACLTGAASAQEGGVLLTFGIENRLEISRNAGLSVPGEGTEVANVTLLSFGLVSETPLDRLTFGVTGGLVARTGDEGSEFDFGRSALTFAYSREVPSAALALAAEFRSDDADSFGDDLGDIGADGTRSDLSLSARLETGRTSGVGLAFGLAYDRTDYQDTTDPDLVDSEEWRGDVAAILRFSEIATGRIGLRYRHREEEDLGTTTTDATTVFAGLDYAISERADLSVELGYTETETEDGGVIARERGPDASVRLSYDMPVGTAYALLSVTTDADEGQRQTFEIGRALETGRDTLAVRLGVTHGDETGTDVIGALEWTRALPDGSLGVSLERRVGYDADDDERVADSIFSLNLTRNLNETTTLLFDASYALRDSPSERIEQVDLDAGFRHQLTRDWGLSGGVGYTVRHEGGRAESPRLFLALSRDFQFRP
ncbi:hypothetical protein [Rhodobacter calidifons]|uniref:Beta-barrel porin 2 n=1 Tax=Rhodobacter calidifons TaxID=2715277 RepID=A0ABX0G741_9RHOB|nr:hypothetical protein [Rhodobacter calidifons]NHB77060.1 hypothetical protein [Rhodobacter calidifons]